MIESPYMKRATGKGDAGVKAEKRFAKRVKGNQTPGSGVKDGAKGDVELPTFLVENKTTTSQSISLKMDWLLKIYQEALETDRYPALSFQFIDGMGNSEKRERWVCIPEHVFAELIEAKHE